MYATPSNRVAVIFGGTGFIGRRLVQRLALAGYQIRIPTRHLAAASLLKPAGTIGQILPLPVRLSDDEAVWRALSGATLAVNLIGILAETRHQKFADLHQALPGRLARLAREAGVASFVQMSSLGASPDSPSAYARTKAAGETAVLAAFPHATVLRPSVVFGPEDQFLNRFAAMAAISPALPLIGGGHTRFQPVWVEDVVSAVLAAVERPEARGKTYELGGPRRYSFRQILDCITHVTRRKRWLVNLPFGLAMLEAAVLEQLPGQLLTRDQVRILRQDNIISDGAATLEQLGITPSSMEAIAPGYLARFRPGGRFGSANAAEDTSLTGGCGF